MSRNTFFGNPIGLFWGHAHSSSGQINSWKLCVGSSAWRLLLSVGILIRVSRMSFKNGLEIRVHNPSSRWCEYFNGGFSHIVTWFGWQHAQFRADTGTVFRRIRDHSWYSEVTGVYWHMCHLLLKQAKNIDREATSRGLTTILSAELYVDGCTVVLRKVRYLV